MTPDTTVTLVPSKAAGRQGVWTGPRITTSATLFRCFQERNQIVWLMIEVAVMIATWQLGKIRSAREAGSVSSAPFFSNTSSERARDSARAR